MGKVHGPVERARNASLTRLDSTKHSYHIITLPFRRVNASTSPICMHLPTPASPPVFLKSASKICRCDVFTGQSAQYARIPSIPGSE